MANVIREDVVKIGFDTDLTELNKLNQGFADLKKMASGGVGGDAFDELKENARQATKDSNNLKDKLKDVAGVTVTKLTSGLKTIADKLTTIGKKAAVLAFNGLKKVAGISFKALTVGIMGAATAVGGLVGSAVSAYADFEQLKGGVETLFGAGGLSLEDYAKTQGKTVDEVKTTYDKLIGAQDQVFKNANDAYKTSGLSANEYMNTVTSFSASLIAGLGGDTEKAAKYANTAIVDMSDNANKMGLIKKSSCKINRNAGKSLKPNKLQRDLKKCA